MLEQWSLRSERKRIDIVDGYHHMGIADTDKRMGIREGFVGRTVLRASKCSGCKLCRDRLAVDMTGKNARGSRDRDVGLAETL